MHDDSKTRPGLTRRELILEASVLALTVKAEAQAPTPRPSTTPGPKRVPARTGTMRALFAGGGKPPHFQSVAVPQIQSAVEAVVRPLSVALCDLDVAYISNRLPTQRPYAVGHEFTAEVIEIGSAVQTLKPGDQVSVPFQISCGGCTRCRSARSLDCTRVEPLSAFGLEPLGGGARWGGALADLVKIPYADAMAVKLPPGSDLIALASLSDNIADGYRCIAPHARPGDDVLVIGSASIGLYAVATAAALGVRCTYVDNVAAHLQAAERLGAHVISSVIDGRSFGEFQVVADCNSTPEALQSAIRSTTGGGICQLTGLNLRPTEVSWFDMFKRGLRLYTGRSSVRDDLPAMLKLIQQGRLQPGAIGPTVVGVDEAPRALQGALSHKTVIKMA